VNIRNLTRSAVLFAACAGIFISGAVTAAEYTGKMIEMRPSNATKGPESKDFSKFYVKGVKVRDEMLIGKSTQVNILRPDKGIAWVLDTATKTYREIKYNGKRGPMFYKTKMMVENLPNVKNLGPEKMNGYDCTKYTVSGGTTSNNSTYTETLWLADKLGMVIKFQFIYEKFSNGFVLQEIKEAKQPDSLFELPKGYKKAKPTTSTSVTSYPAPAPPMPYQLPPPLSPSGR
jgi:outer membrane lipoprotein-sorting protein